MDVNEALNPSQKNVLEHLGAKLADRPLFSGELQSELKEELSIRLSKFQEFIPENETLFVSKFHLNQIMRCERQFIADRESQFQWSVPTARGLISHKAIELSVFWDHEVEPLSLVDEAISRCANGDDALASWLHGLQDGDRSQLRSDVNNRVAAFLESWPPLKKEWRPMLEAPIRAEFAQGAIILSGKVDLSLGKPLGTTAGKVIVDFKTGGFYSSHREDLRFYALLESIRLGVPPRMVATYYLDRSEFSSENITENVLESALFRVEDGIERIVNILFKGSEPQMCSSEWCGLCTDQES
ncbi:MAG: hypothetical protein CL453_03545 [Acidimicrobiaceae bacterium]|nr:hypothetical protein [Acidimicrobiaceae bacterium]